jgi:hypothetical protein
MMAADKNPALPVWSTYKAHGNQPTAYIGDAAHPYETFDVDAKGSAAGPSA